MTSKMNAHKSIIMEQNDMSKAVSKQMFFGEKWF